MLPSESSEKVELEDKCISVQKFLETHALIFITCIAMSVSKAPHSNEYSNKVCLKLLPWSENSA